MLFHTLRTMDTHTPEKTYACTLENMPKYIHDGKHAYMENTNSCTFAYKKCLSHLGAL